MAREGSPTVVSTGFRLFAPLLCTPFPNFAHNSNLLRKNNSEITLNLHRRYKEVQPAPEDASPSHL